MTANDCLIKIRRPSDVASLETEGTHPKDEEEPIQLFEITKVQRVLPK